MVGMLLQTILAETDEVQIIQIPEATVVVQGITVLLIQKDQVTVIQIIDLVIEIVLDLIIAEVIIVLQPLLADHTRLVQEVVHPASEVVLQV
jgi:hypothetical protein